MAWLVFVIIVIPGAVSGQDVEDITTTAREELARSSLAGDEYQTTLPTMTHGSPPPVALIRLVYYLAWIALIVFVSFLLIMIGRFVADRMARVPEGSAKSVKNPVSAGFDADISDADGLADAGEYAAAVHALLLATIRELESRQGTAVQDAATSREIRDAFAMPDAARAPFARLVDAVEISYFGGRAATVRDWEICRGAFDEFSATAGGAR